MTQPSSTVQQRHEYPPTPASSSSNTSSQTKQPSVSGSASSLSHSHLTGQTDVIRFLVHTESSDIRDLRLQVSQDPQPHSSSTQPLIPVWFRQRILTENDEIVDQLVDSSTGRISWNIHRPTRGWYIYLKSPLLPSGTAIALRLDKIVEHDPSISPLSFSLTTKIRPSSLASAKPTISQADQTLSSSTEAAQNATNTSPTFATKQSELFQISLQDAITRHAKFPSLSMSRAGSAIGASRIKKHDDDDDDGGNDAAFRNQQQESDPKHPATKPSEQIQAHATGRSENVHVSTEMGMGHARRRSGVSSNLDVPGKRKVSNRIQTAVPSPTIHEAVDEVGIFTSNPDPTFPSKALTSTLHLKSSSSTLAKPEAQSAVDRPYSPLEPKSFFTSDPNTHGNLDNRNSTIGGRPFHSESPRPQTLSQPSLCSFLLCDGSRRPQLLSHHSQQATNDDTNSRRKSTIELQGKQGWARWAWSIVPKDLRPVLSFDTDKSFSIYWLNPPSLSTNTNGSIPHTSRLDRSIEVLHFTDQSGWWFWDAKTRGTLTLQKSVIQSIGLELEFWIATALAYLEFLEEKDGYEAAREG